MTRLRNVENQKNTKPAQQWPPMTQHLPITNLGATGGGCEDIWEGHLPASDTAGTVDQREPRVDGPEAPESHVHTQSWVDPRLQPPGEGWVHLTQVQTFSRCPSGQTAM